MNAGRLALNESSESSLNRRKRHSSSSPDRKTSTGRIGTPRHNCNMVGLSRRTVQAQRLSHSAPLSMRDEDRRVRETIVVTVMILPQVHLRKPCYDFYFL